jgi:putative sterol carrier protein
MPKFPTQEWASEYVEKLNSNPAYKDAGKNWEGDITFVIRKDDSFDSDAYLYLDLHHGECRGFKFSMDSSVVPESEFKYVGKYSNWMRLINKEIDPIQGILTGKFKLEGSMMKIMKFTKAAKEMVSTASTVNLE